MGRKDLWFDSVPLSKAPYSPNICSPGAHMAAHCSEQPCEMGLKAERLVAERSQSRERIATRLHIIPWGYIAGGLYCQTPLKWFEGSLYCYMRATATAQHSTNPPDWSLCTGLLSVLSQKRMSTGRSFFSFAPRRDARTNMQLPGRPPSLWAPLAFDY
ncbi:unnamed protein product [Pleuronectes platessa]|uniref:Uncharacterized protein n=1 Tax=Pleuronectes platessa TaxID=8262 RepID=A0A9N7UYS9_PLEPL|nr:unnamed protein product [Pleuronectes platessa]